MMGSLKPSTPPALTIHTPNTPQFGFDDKYLLSSPRRSARLAHLQNFQNSIASPRSESYNIRNNCTPLPRQTLSFTSANDISTPAVRKLLKKQTTKNLDSSKSLKVKTNIPSPKIAAGPFQLTDSFISTSALEIYSESSSTNCQNGMLPTPTKTPVKRRHKNSGSISSIAYNLFPTQTSILNESRRSSKRNYYEKDGGIDLTKCGVMKNSNPIAIFTDSYDRIPEKDTSPHNPFLVDSSSEIDKSLRRSSKRRKIMVPGEGVKSIEELERRNDGLLYVFRGKKVWRRFSEKSDDDMKIKRKCKYDGFCNSSYAEPYLNRSSTRSSAKPRLLFSRDQIPQTQKLDLHDTDEEADTDIDDSIFRKSGDRIEENVTTPKISKFLLTSPPSTIRATRSKKANLKRDLSTPTANNDMEMITAGSCSFNDIGKGSPSKSHHSLKSRSGKRKIKGR